MLAPAASVAGGHIYEFSSGKTKVHFYGPFQEFVQ